MLTLFQASEPGRQHRRNTVKCLVTVRHTHPLEQRTNPAIPYVGVRIQLVHGERLFANRRPVLPSKKAPDIRDQNLLCARNHLTRDVLSNLPAFRSFVATNPYSRRQVDIEFARRLPYISLHENSRIPHSLGRRACDQARRGELHRATKLFALRRGNFVGQLAGARHPVNIVQTANEALDLLEPRSRPSDSESLILDRDMAASVRRLGEHCRKVGQCTQIRHVRVEPQYIFNRNRGAFRIPELRRIYVRIEQFLSSFATRNVEPQLDP